MDRRLAAILAADVVGYSRLVGIDEAGTIAALKRYRTEIFDPKIAQYRGRTVKLMGDGTLIEFPSVVDAVTCAVEVQVLMRRHNDEIPDDRRVDFRIGINLGDVIVEADDLYGDGVNVAARLEGLAEPGGICLSRSARDQIRDRLDLDLEDLGEIEVKNIARPVRAFRIVLDEKAKALVTALVPTAMGRRRPARWFAAAGVVAALSGGIVWWAPWAPDTEPASLARMAFPLPDKPSLAVLPFANLSGNAEQEYLVDGITSDLITDLSKFKNLFVIAANSTFAYKGRRVKVQDVAEELGVQYVLEGSVQRAGNTIRINTQLIDALSGRHLWAERYDDDLDDVLAVQDRVVDKVVLELAVKLEAGEQSKSDHPAGLSVESYELFQRAQAILPSYFADTNNLAEARELFEKLVAREANFAGGYAGLSRCYSLSVMRGYTRAQDTDAARALEFAEKARELDPEREFTRLALADAQFAVGRLEEAVGTLEALIQDAPSSAEAHGRLGLLLVWAGRSREAFDHIDAAIRLNPFVGSPYLNFLGLAEFTVGRYDAAVAAFEKNAARGGPIDDAGLAALTASYSELGRTAEAQSSLARLIDRYPGAHLRSFWLLRNFARREDRIRLTETLKRADVPMDRPYTR